MVETRKSNVMVVKNKDKVSKGGISFIGFVIRHVAITEEMMLAGYA